MDKNSLVFKVGAAVDAAQANASWAAKNLTDGILTHLGGTQGWSSKKQPANLVFPAPIIAVIDLGEDKAFDRFQLYPRSSYWGPDGEPVNFVKAYSILVSNDGVNYREVYSTEQETTNGWNPVVVQLHEAVEARYIKLSFIESNQFGDTTTGSYIQLSEFGNEQADVPFAESVTAPAEAAAGELFEVTAITRDDVAKVALFNEYGLKMGLKNVARTDNRDGTATWTFKTSIGTAGTGRVLTLATIGADGVYTITEASFSIDVKPGIVSAAIEETAMVNQPVTLTVVTSKDVKRILIKNEYGLSMGTQSQTYVDTEEGRVWTVEMKIGTKGTRSFFVSGKNAYGDLTDAVQTNTVIVSAF